MKYNGDDVLLNFQKPYAKSLDCSFLKVALMRKEDGYIYVILAIEDSNGELVEYQQIPVV